MESSGGDYIYHKRKRSNFRNFTAVWNEQKKGQVGISETGRKGGVWRLPEAEKVGLRSTHVSLQRSVYVKMYTEQIQGRLKLTVEGKMVSGVTRSDLGEQWHVWLTEEAVALVT